MSLQAIHELMAQAGPVLELEQVTEFAEDAAWALAFDRETQIDVEYDEAGARLVLTGNVGAVPEHARAKAYEALLQYTYIWTEHGGVRAALDPLNALVVLMVELPVAGLEISRLASVVQNFRGAIEGWRGVLASIAAGGGEAAVAFPDSGMLRV